MKTLPFIALCGLLISVSPRSLTAQDAAQVAQGARFWAQNCTRCHNARSPLEADDRDWTTIILHMRARANLSKAESQAIITYMQAVNGSPSTTRLSNEFESEQNGISEAVSGSRRTEMQIMRAHPRVPFGLQPIPPLFARADAH